MKKKRIIIKLFFLGLVISSGFSIGSLMIIETSLNKDIVINDTKDIVEVMNDLASAKMDDLIATNYWSHTNSDGCDFFCRTVRSGMYSSNTEWLGENLYRGSCSEQKAFELWEKSPAHAEILRHKYDKQLLLTERYSDGCYMILIRGEIKND